MGVAGVGKTTIGTLLAERLGWAFFDADDFHPSENVAKMRSGVALTDDDRSGWLDALRERIEAQLASGEPAVLACSALKSSYRRKLTNGHDRVAVVYLQATRDLIADRLGSRVGHFFGADLVSSQFATLEEPREALVVDAGAPPNVIVDEIVRALNLEDEAG